MVAPQEVDSIGVQDLEAGQQQDSLQGIVPSVHVVSQKQVSRQGQFSS